MRQHPLPDGTAGAKASTDTHKSDPQSAMPDPSGARPSGPIAAGPLAGSRGVGGRRRRAASIAALADRARRSAPPPMDAPTPDAVAPAQPIPCEAQRDPVAADGLASDTAPGTPAQSSDAMPWHVAGTATARHLPCITLRVAGTVPRDSPPPDSPPPVPPSPDIPGPVLFRRARRQPPPTTGPSRATAGPDAQVPAGPLILDRSAQAAPRGGADAGPPRPAESPTATTDPAAEVTRAPIASPAIGSDPRPGHRAPMGPPPKPLPIPATPAKAGWPARPVGAAPIAVPKIPPRRLRPEPSLPGTGSAGLQVPGRGAGEPLLIGSGGIGMALARLAERRRTGDLAPPGGPTSSRTCPAAP